MQRDVARAQAAQARSYAQAEAAKARAHSAQLRARAAEDREQRRLYGLARADEVAAMNAQLEQQVEELEQILADGLRSHPALRFEALKQEVVEPEQTYLQWQTPAPAPALEEFLPPKPTGISKMFAKAKHERAVADARAAHQQALTEHAMSERHRVAQFAATKAAYDAQLADERQPRSVSMPMSTPSPPPIRPGTRPRSSATASSRSPAVCIPTASPPRSRSLTSPNRARPSSSTRCRLST